MPASFVLFLLPLGLDTLGVSLGLGIKGDAALPDKDGARSPGIPLWLRSAILFALAETLMPLVGLAIGYTASVLISGIMNIIGALLLIAVGGWELLDEVFERYRKRCAAQPPPTMTMAGQAQSAHFSWRQQLLLALSVSLDELAVGFSFGAFTARLTSGGKLSPLLFCLYIGIQGLLMAVIGIMLGSILRRRLRWLQEWSELISAVLLIGLGIWLLM
ncbi:MAG TPA: manganese efflux pump [Ktedonobacteraceae bacterium]|nr:manganese efflux pump [Ktedonobacteraceae bacterium]